MTGMSWQRVRPMDLVRTGSLAFFKLSRSSVKKFCRRTQDVFDFFVFWFSMAFGEVLIGGGSSRKRNSYFLKTSTTVV